VLSQALLFASMLGIVISKMTKSPIVALVLKDLVERGVRMVNIHTVLLITHIVSNTIISYGKCIATVINA